MSSYYSTVLSGSRLQRCYEIAPPRVQQYLREETNHVRDCLDCSGTVLELGCGYGRVTSGLATTARRSIGIDTSIESLALARSGRNDRCSYGCMDAAGLALKDRCVDAVVCIQNGACSFHVDPVVLLREALRVVRRPGRILFSAYAERFWHDRLEWFRLQADEGLIGPIDEGATREGTIVCRDGLSLGTLTPARFHDVCARLGVRGNLMEVDGSSLFCEISV